jgi:serine/threonine protein kinase
MGDDQLEPSDIENPAVAVPSGTTCGLTVHLPLGVSPLALVFLVRESSPGGRLLRLKRWRVAVDERFLSRFAELRDRLAAWRHVGVARPLTAWLDEEGRPSVLSEFVQGVPIVHALKSGAVAGAQALEWIRPLRETLCAAHAEGLAHGSLVSGNVILQPWTASAYLLDFGMAQVCFPESGSAASLSSDRRHLAALLRTLRGDFDLT